MAEDTWKYFADNFEMLCGISAWFLARRGGDPQDASAIVVDVAFSIVEGNHQIDVARRPGYVIRSIENRIIDGHRATLRGPKTRLFSDCARHGQEGDEPSVFEFEVASGEEAPENQVDLLLESEMRRRVQDGVRSSAGILSLSEAIAFRAILLAGGDSVLAMKQLQLSSTDSESDKQSRYYQPLSRARKKLKGELSALFEFAERVGLRFSKECLMEAVEARIAALREGQGNKL